MTAGKKPLVDDLADVLSRVVVGWEDVLGVDLAEHPEVQRVMARYRQVRLASGDLRPRIWELPEEPGAEVQAVRDGDGDEWRRSGESGWHVHNEACREVGLCPARGGRWGSVMAFAPLTDVTGEAV